MPNDSGPNSVLTIKVKDGLEQEDGKWLFFSEEFRSFSYGDTEQEAIDTFFNTLQHVIKRFESREELKASSTQEECTTASMTGRSPRRSGALRSRSVPHRYEWDKVIQVFEAFGLTIVDKLGDECLLAGVDGYVWVPMNQSFSEGGVNRFLASNGINQEDFWALYGELFVD